MISLRKIFSRELYRLSIIGRASPYKPGIEIIHQGDMTLAQDCITAAMEADPVVCMQILDSVGRMISQSNCSLIELIDHSVKEVEKRRPDFKKSPLYGEYLANIDKIEKGIK